jgi:neopullulanase
MLGGNRALSQLLDEAHGRGMRVILDGVFNHASRGFFQFHDILENGRRSAYIDWFTVHGFPLHAYESERKPNYAAWWGLHALPKFNIKNPEVRDFLLGIARRWVEFGIDGWRLDVPNEIDDDDFWRRFRQTVRDANPDSYIVGEIWHDASRWLQGDMWDAVMNYSLTRALLAFVIGDEGDASLIEPTSLHPLGPPGAEAFGKALTSILERHHGQVNHSMLNLVGSHDMARIISLGRGDASATRLALLFLMTFPGAPCIYYGDEIGMSGGHDPHNRAAFPWHAPDSWDHDLRRDVRQFIQLRHRSPCLRHGEFRAIHAKQRLFAFERTGSTGERMIVALNAGGSTDRIDLTLENGVHPRWTARDALSGESLPPITSARMKLSIPARTGRVILLEPGVG